MSAGGHEEGTQLERLLEIARAQLEAQRETNELLDAILTRQEARYGATPAPYPPPPPGSAPRGPVGTTHNRLPDVMTTIGTMQVSCSCGWMEGRLNTNRAWRKHIEKVSRAQS